MNNFLYNSCFSSIARRNSNLELCKRISDEKVKNLCFEDIIRNVNDPKHCNLLLSDDYDYTGYYQELKSFTSCIIKVVVNTGNSEFCTIINKDEERDTCYFKASTYVNYYSLIKEDKRKDSCYLINENKKRDECYKWIAISLSDIQLCNNILNELERDICYKDVAVWLYDIQLCDNIQQEMQRLFCYIDVYRLSDNPNDCTIIDDLETQNTCYR